MTTRLIAIDTATETAHLALGIDEAVLVRTLPGGAQTSTTLLPALQALLAEAGCGWHDLDAIGFGRGPGAFTGLRTAASVAQGLALGLDRPVLLLDTLAAVAEAAWRAGGGAVDATCLWAATDARMGEIYAAPWCRSGDGDWRLMAGVALYTAEALSGRLAGDAVLPPASALAGNALRIHALRLPAALRCCVDADPDGLAIAALARAAWRAGHLTDPALALPLYVRDKVAQTTAERAAPRRLAEVTR